MIPARVLQKVTFSVALVLTSARNGAAATGQPLECRDRNAAKEHLIRGLELYEKKKLDAALPEIRQSRENCPTENNTLNLALLLRDLGRPIDGLDTVDELERDFPALSPENAETAKQLRRDLEKIVGSAILDGDVPGASIVIDGTNIGTMPMARPIRLTIGMHLVRVELAGHHPLETSFVVKTQQTTSVAVALAPMGQPPPRPRPNLAKHGLRFDASLGLSPTLGGNVYWCDDSCGGGPGLGVMIMGGYRGLVASPIRLGGIVGYTFLWQHREGTVGADGVNIPNGGRWPVADDLLMHAFFAAPEISGVFYIGEHRFDAGLALGIVGGPLVNLRGRRQNGPDFMITPPPSMPSTTLLGFATFLEASWHSPWSLFGRWPMQITLGVLGIAPGSTPLYKEKFRGGTSSGEFHDRLLGSWVLTFTPGIALAYDL